MPLALLSIAVQNFRPIVRVYNEGPNRKLPPLDVKIEFIHFSTLQSRSVYFNVTVTVRLLQSHLNDIWLRTLNNNRATGSNKPTEIFKTIGIAVLKKTCEYFVNWLFNVMIKIFFTLFRIYSRRTFGYQWENRWVLCTGPPSSHGSKFGRYEIEIQINFGKEVRTATFVQVVAREPKSLVTVG